jgi:site-specific recombinase XerD
LMAELIYGAGLRVGECVTLRVKDVDFTSKVLNIRDGNCGARQNESAFTWQEQSRLVTRLRAGFE